MVVSYEYDYLLSGISNLNRVCSLMFSAMFIECDRLQNNIEEHIIKVHRLTYLYWFLYHNMTHCDNVGGKLCQMKTGTNFDFFYILTTLCCLIFYANDFIIIFRFLF